jgi:hypothetical protein
MIIWLLTTVLYSLVLASKKYRIKIRNNIPQSSSYLGITSTHISKNHKSSQDGGLDD